MSKVDTDRKNTKPTEMFTFGSTKNAVILLDMAKTMQEINPKKHKNWATKMIGASLNKVIDTLNLVENIYQHESEFINRAPKFREHLVYNTMKNELDKLSNDTHFSTMEVFEAVVKEHVNKRRRIYGLVGDAPTDYTPSDLVAWNETENVKKARNAWKGVYGRYVS